MFQFRLQRVLNLRAEKEQQAASELAEAAALAARVRAQQESLEDRLTQGLSRIAASAGTPRPVGEMRSRCFVVDQLGQRIVQARQDVVRAEAEVEQSRGRYAEAFRDRRVLDRLREKNLTQWQAEETRADLARMDGIALTRFARIDAQTNEEEA